jgi:hypothetical protein
VFRLGKNVEGDQFEVIASSILREVEMNDLQIRAAVQRHGTASAAGDQDAEHEIYHDDAIVDDYLTPERLAPTLSNTDREGRSETSCCTFAGCQHRPVKTSDSFREFSARPPV